MDGTSGAEYRDVILPWHRLYAKWNVEKFLFYSRVAIILLLGD